MYPSQTKEFLENLLSNEDLLLKEIEDSKGYVLYQMKKYDLKPDIDFLLSVADSNSLFFIDDNYSLSTKQFDKIKHFYDGQKVIIRNLTEKEIIEYLTFKKELPENTILSLNVLKNHMDDFKEQYQHDDYKADKILTKSIGKLNDEQFLSLGDKFLSSKLYLFDEKYNIMTGKIKKKYLELMLLEPKEEMRITNFTHYQFEEEDKELINSLIRNSKDQIYKDHFYRLPNVMNVINIWDYNEYMEDNYSKNSLGEIESNVDKIHKNIFNRGRYSPFSSIIIGLSLEKLKVIINQDFFKKLNDSDSYNMSYKRIDSADESYESKLKLAYIKHELLKSTLTNENILNYVDYSDFTSYIKEITQLDVYSESKEIMDELEVITINYLNKKIESPDFINMPNTYSGLDLSRKYIKIWNELPSSINLLSVLMKDFYNKNKKTDNDRYKTDIQDLKKLITKLIKSLDKNQVSKLADYFDYSLPLMYSSDYKNETNINNNFFNYDIKNYKELDEDTMILLISVEDKFRNLILDNKLQLPEAVEYHLIHLQDKKLYGFTKNYIAQNEERIKNNSSYIKVLLKSDNYKKVIDIDSSLSNERNYKILLDLSSFQSKLQKINETPDYHEAQLSDDDISILSKLLTENKFEEILNNKFYVSDNMYRTQHVVSNMISEVSDLIDSSYKKDMTKKLISEKDYHQISDLYHRRNWNIDLFVKHVNSMKYEEIVSALDNEYFKKIISSMVGYNAETKIKFNIKNKKESYEISQLLYDNFDKDLKMLEMIGSECDNFDIKFIINNKPSALIYDYRYSDIILSNQQILEIYNNVEKTSDVLIGKDVNSSMNDFISRQYRDRKEDYFEMLEIAKNNYPKLYFLLSNTSLMRDFYEHPKGEEPSRNGDKDTMNFFIKNFNLDIVLKGFEEIIDKVKSFENENISHYNYKKILHNFIFPTYYDERDYTSSQTKYYSSLSENDSNKIVEKIIDKAPFFIYCQQVIGSLDNLSEYIGQNIEKYTHIDNIIDKLLMPDYQFTDSYFAFNGRYEKYIHDISEGLINYYVSENKEQEIEYIDFLFKKFKFASKLNYDYGYSVPDIIADILEKRPLLSNMVEKSCFHAKLSNQIPTKTEKIKSKKL